MSREVVDMAVLTVQRITQDGVTPSFVSADVGGDEFANGGRTFFYVKNGGASQITVTVDSVKQCNFGFDHDLTVDIPAGEERIIGPFDPGRFNNSSARVAVSYSDVTSVTVAALEV